MPVALCSSSGQWVIVKFPKLIHVNRHDDLRSMFLVKPNVILHAIIVYRSIIDLYHILIKIIH